MLKLPHFNNQETQKCLDIITLFYDGKSAKRSKVPYMNHIIEGIAVLDDMNRFGGGAAIGAYALHPLLQQDDDLKRNLPILIRNGISAENIALTMEYRKVANAYLSHRKINNLHDIELSPLRAVNEMLIADKVQNKKDFIIYHKGTHPRSDELEEYFNNWLERLGVSDRTYQEYVKIMKNVHK